MELSHEQRNFVKLSHILLNIVANHLREFFVRKWDEKYPKEQWSNDNTSGERLCTKITKKMENDHVKNMKSGDVQKWDITTLGKVFLYSGLELIPKNSSEIDEIHNIRKIRNSFFANLDSMSCSDIDFVRTLAKIRKSARVLFREDVVNEIDEIEKLLSDKTSIENVLELLKHEIDKYAELSEKLNSKYYFPISFRFYIIQKSTITAHNYKTIPQGLLLLVPYLMTSATSLCHLFLFSVH